MAEFDDLVETLKRGAAALRDASVPFLLGGGLAVWARGGPETEHDLDLMVKPEDAERALKALEDAGFRGENPPEDWLYKAWGGNVLIDIIFDPMGNPVDDKMFARADELEVNAVSMKVMSLEDVMATKLLAMREHEVDYESVLEIARALREQIDWDVVWRETKDSPFARTFFYLAEQLGVLEEPRASAGETGSSQAPSGAATRQRP
jgi:predicted nucleotidyltransferase